jgi:hypothetical protein
MNYVDKKSKLYNDIFILSNIKRFQIINSPHFFNEKASNFRKNIYYNNFLYPEDRVPRKNLAIWIAELTIELDYIKDLMNLSTNRDKLARLLNLSSFVLCSMGNVADAQTLCLNQIDYFVKLSKNDIYFLHYCIQPWINLARIDRILGHFDQAKEKFEILKSLCGNAKKILIFNHQIERSSLVAAINGHLETKNVIKACTFFDVIKIYLMSKKYQEMVNFAESYLDDGALNGIAHEAAIIGYLSMKDTNKAIDLVQSALINTSQKFLHIFLFRQAELQVMSDNKQFEEIFLQLFELIKYFEGRGAQIQNAFFSAKVAGQFLKYGFHRLAYYVLEFATLLAKKSNDELLTIECLEGLAKLDDSGKHKKSLELILESTGYISVINKYSTQNKIQRSTVFNDLTIKANQLFKSLQSIL